MRDLLDIVDSFEKLEILLEVYRSGSLLQGSEELATKLELPRDVVDEALADLLDRNVVCTAQSKWWFDGASSRGEAVARLATLYEDDRLLVLRMITEAALQRVRSQAARVFADAFVIRSPKKKGPGNG